MTEDFIDDESAQDQHTNSRLPERLKPWMYKKGQSGNPGGRPKGISLKEYVKNKFAQMTPDEREEFLEGVNKKEIWEMGEGKAEGKDSLDVKGDIIIKRVSFDEYNNDSPQPEAKQS